MKQSQKFIYIAVERRGGKSQVIHAAFASKSHKETGDWLRFFQRLWKEEGVVLDKSVPPVLVRINE